MCVFAYMYDHKACRYLDTSLAFLYSANVVSPFFLRNADNFPQAKSPRPRRIRVGNVVSGDAACTLHWCNLILRKEGHNYLVAMNGPVPITHALEDDIGALEHILFTSSDAPGSKWNRSG